jgi:two-component system sensor histidine kinase PilS (NtrC family)
MPASAATAQASPGDLPRRILWLLSLYRLLVPLVLLLMQRLAYAPWSLVIPGPGLFLPACVAYLGVAALLLVEPRLKWPSLRSMALVNAFVDSAGLALILYASGGVASGLGILLVLPVMAMATLAGPRTALVVGAIASISVLAQQVFVDLFQRMTATDYATAAVLGAVLFAIALSASPIANRLHENEALVRRQEVDLANLADLSQHVVQRFREGLLVIDSSDRVRLINESASRLLGSINIRPEAPLGEISLRLLHLLESWRQSGGAGGSTDRTFASADGARMVRADFAPLGKAAPAPVLVFLEDTSVLAEKVQQRKLAALARLSASIAHEVKNPVGAMSHAGQLLAESEGLSVEDRELTQIIRRNANRVSAIIDNVHQLSRGDTHLEQLALQSWIEEFQVEFCDTMQFPRERLHVSGPAPDIDVRADPDQLRQIVWNLCENAIKHAIGESQDQSIELKYGRMLLNNRPFLEVCDRGPGVPLEQTERIFEPFFSTGRGTGLGLFLARELAETSGATLLYEARAGGGSIFRIIFSDPERWEKRA